MQGAVRLAAADVRMRRRCAVLVARTAPASPPPTHLHTCLPPPPPPPPQIGFHETITAPHMHATCLELLRDHLKPGARVLDVGSGEALPLEGLVATTSHAGWLPPPLLPPTCLPPPPSPPPPRPAPGSGYLSAALGLMVGETGEAR